MELNYLDSVTKQFEYYRFLGEQTFKQLEEKDLFWAFNTTSNSIAVIVNHLSGNMRSRWTNFLISDGEKPWRNRDEEFESHMKSREELLLKWNGGWQCLLEALHSIDQENFNTKILIRNQEHSIIEAVNRQLAHYSYHMGQIVFIGRMIKGEEWKSLSIPKGESNHFNSTKFSRGKHGGHFTDDLI